MDRDYADIIQKLFDKAERTESEAERTALETKISELMAKHSIDEAMLSAKRKAEGRSHEDDEIINVTISYEGQYAQALQHWTHTVGKAFGCETLWSSDKTKRTHRTTFLYGYRADVEQVQMLLDSLRLQLLRPLKEFQRAQKGQYFDTTVGAFIERRAFVQAFAVGAASKIYNERKALAEGAYKSSGAEVVLFDRKAAVEKHVKARLSGRSSGRGINSGTGQGWASGHAAGRSANVTTGNARRGINA